jgi:manganese transport protein
MQDSVDNAALSGRLAVAGVRQAQDAVWLSGWRSIAMFAGPSVAAAVAYVDPGNFATNIEAGAKYGYSLLWVVIIANLMAMLFQALAARVGLVTGKGLAHLFNTALPRRWRVPAWLLFEAAAMATDLAEFTGAALGFSLLIDVSLMVGLVITAVLTMAMLHLERIGFRKFELAIAVLVAVVSLAYLGQLAMTTVPWLLVLRGSAIPHIQDSHALLVAVGIIGATIMPHALFLHSGLTQRLRARHPDVPLSRLLRFTTREVVVALTMAGLVNVAMVIASSAAFNGLHSSLTGIGNAWLALTPILGKAAAALFLTALICSGVSSSVVGTLAGQMIMEGFTGYTLPLWLRRTITFIPAMVVVGSGVNVDTALVVSQVALSIALPVPMLALIYFASNTRFMGVHRVSMSTLTAACCAAFFVLAFNVVLATDACGLPTIAILHALATLVG